MIRRKFIQTATIAATALALSACDKPATEAVNGASTSAEKFRWR